MFRKSLIPIVLFTSATLAFSSILPLNAHAQFMTNDQSGPVSVLKKKDFSTTLDALQGLVHRTIPLEDMKPKEETKQQTSSSLEEKADKIEADEKTETTVNTNKKATSQADLNKSVTDKNADNKKTETHKTNDEGTSEETANDDAQKDASEIKDETVAKKDEAEKKSASQEETISKKETEKAERNKPDSTDKDKKGEKSNDVSNEKDQSEPIKPQRSVLPRQYIDLHFANYSDTRLFLKDLTKRFGAPLASCSRSSINFYRLPDDFTLRVHMTNLNPDEVSPGSSVDGINGIHMLLIDGKISDDCDIDTLRPEERIVFNKLKQLTQEVLNAKANLDEEKAQTLISSFGTPKRDEKECFITYSIKPEKDLPQLDVSISVIKPDCKLKSGYAGLHIHYEPLEKNGVVLPNDPAMAIKMARSLEQTFNMESLHNIVYLWKNGDVFGIIKAPISPFIPMAFAIVEPEDKLSMEVGQWFGKDENHYQTLWNAGEQPYGGLTTSEEFIP